MSKKMLAAQIWAKWVKIGPRISFLPFFKFGLLGFLEIAQYDSLEHLLIRVKPLKKIFRASNWAQN